jgi:hypothetical protein
MEKIILIIIFCILSSGITYGQTKSHVVAVKQTVAKTSTEKVKQSNQLSSLDNGQVHKSVNQQTSMKTAMKPILTSTQKLLNEYRYNEAITQLQKDIKLKQAKKQSIESEKSDLKIAETGQKMLAATQKIIFIDSIVTTYDKFLSKIQLSKESGTIKPFNDFFKSGNQPDAYLYLNELGNKCYYSMEDSLENMSLYTNDKLDGKWGEPSEISINGNQSDQMNYPYMMSDGTTLYFAATGSESLGGYDIFVTRYDSESGNFLKAENIGMPFNSPANDYMYAEDELDNIGWFVTDRNQPAGKVCIYIFIPSDTRQIYESDKYSPEQIRQFAMISKISDTWGDGQEREQAIARLNKAINAKKKTNKVNFIFVVNDNIVYTSLSDFKNPVSKQKMEELTSKQKSLKDINNSLESLRGSYAKSNENEKAELRTSILQDEQQIMKLQEEIKQTEKFIRNTELSSINK